MRRHPPSLPFAFALLWAKRKFDNQIFAYPNLLCSDVGVLFGVNIRMACNLTEQAGAEQMLLEIERSRRALSAWGRCLPIDQLIIYRASVAQTRKLHCMLQWSCRLQRIVLLMTSGLSKTKRLLMCTYRRSSEIGKKFAVDLAACPRAHTNVL